MVKVTAYPEKGARTTPVAGPRRMVPMLGWTMAWQAFLAAWNTNGKDHEICTESRVESSSWSPNEALNGSRVESWKTKFTSQSLGDCSKMNLNSPAIETTEKTSKTDVRGGIFEESQNFQFFDFSN